LGYNHANLSQRYSHLFFSKPKMVFGDMSKCAFITGIGGQDGAYLAKFLIEKGYTVHGSVRERSSKALFRLARLGVLENVHLHKVDLNDQEAISRTLDDLSPTEFYNFAAQSSVRASWDFPLETADLDGLGVARLLEAMRLASGCCRFYQASSSEMFGLAQEVPQLETTRLYPRSPYGVAKVFGHLITINYRESYGVHASSGILFNHESPLRSETFVTRKITKGLAALARGSNQPIGLGNINAQRDWGFAGDYVEGMWRMLQQDVGGDFILATGTATSIREFFTYAAEALGLVPVFQGEGVDEVAVDRGSGRQLMYVDPAFFRPAEVDLTIGDASKAKAVLGWEPCVHVRGLAEMMARADYDALQ
jgi:GDPmannose 4,6-dehydratase